MPGLAHHESIDNNHYFLTQPGAKIGVLRGNPVSKDAAEFAAKLPMHFIVYAVAAQLRGTFVTAVTRLQDAWKLANLIAGRDSKVLLIEKARRLILC